MQLGDVFNMKLNCLAFFLMTALVVFAQAGNYTQEELDFKKMMALFDESPVSGLPALPADLLRELQDLTSDVDEGAAALVPEVDKEFREWLASATDLSNYELAPI